MATRLRFDHMHDREPEEVESLGLWVVERAVTIEGGLALRVRRPAVHAYPSGLAYYRRPDFARKLRCRYGMTVRLPGPTHKLGVPRVCWHSATTKRRHYSEDAPPSGLQVTVEEALSTGKDKVGKWPIYHTDTWQEAFIHTAAHELSHIVQAQRGRGQSEVVCEMFAAHVLDEWRSAAMREP